MYRKIVADSPLVLPFLRLISNTKALMAERLTTRSKNPGTHPGLCDAPKPRRSAAEVAADKEANDAP